MLLDLFREEEKRRSSIKLGPNIAKSKKNV